MHVVTREVNESLVIDGEIKIKVLDIGEHDVRLGIHAPNENPSYWEQTLSLQDELATSSSR